MKQMMNVLLKYALKKRIFVICNIKAPDSEGSGDGLIVSLVIMIITNFFINSLLLFLL